jgi:hypothetical protein
VKIAYSAIEATKKNFSGISTVWGTLVWSKGPPTPQTAA